MVLKDIDQQLLSITKAEDCSWHQIGEVLHIVDQSNYWSPDYDSYTDWLKHLAESINLKPASLWRYLSSVRYLNLLSDKSIVDKEFLKNIKSQPIKISAESIELLSKIERVVSENIFKETALKVISSTITRVQLRNLWQIYRPILDGKNGRGKGVVASKFDKNDSIQVKRMLDSEIIFALVNEKKLCKSNPLIYKSFKDVTLKKDGIKSIEIDMVVVVKEDSISSVQIHIIEITSSFNMSFIKNLGERSMFCDYLWIAIHDKLKMKLWVKNLPKNIGIMYLENNLLQVERFAESTPQYGRQIEMMYEVLLTKTLA